MHPLMYYIIYIDTFLTILESIRHISKYIVILYNISNFLMKQQLLNPEPLNPEPSETTASCLAPETHTMAPCPGATLVFEDII